ncbi:MAG: EI24 domain-containing protein [Planctomycetes bacterium]|nr:EI24 domain-containing protein [Planctomycetota bacterium]
MFDAFARAIGQLFDPRILRVLGLCVLLSVLCIVLAWLGVAWLLSSRLVETEWLETTIDVLGVVATLALTYLLFPLLASAFVGLFLDKIARAVEARHYPHLPAAPGLPFWSGLGASLRFLVLIVVVNLLLLILLLFPVAYPVGYLVGNGYLVAREYFELVAFRRLSPSAARTMRSRRGGELLLLGVVTAFLFTVPFVNFIAPVIATAAMVHRFEAWRAADDHAAGGG